VPRGVSPDLSTIRALADQAFSRAAGAPLIGGNHVRVLRDAAENYPAWEHAIARATATIDVEMYIVHRDDVGRRFVAWLAGRARAGVRVRVIYDWFGCGLGPALGLFRPLVEAGGDVRPFNPPSLTAALGWLRRNHRKQIIVDSHVAFVAGLCVGRMWEGRPDRGQAPWRDTGLEIIGPAVRHAERAFAESWRLSGGQTDPDARPGPEPPVVAHPVALRLIATEPFTASLLRADLLVAAMARRTLWITDAYFFGHGPYLEALRRAAHDGVDVRLLLPQGSDVGWTVPISRTLYRALLEAGVRIFEWNSTMIHAKTAVADSRWARVGSTNLNLSSWLGNWELDVALDDEHIARQLEAHFLSDLEHSTELVLDPTRRRAIAMTAGRRRGRSRRSARRVVRTVTGLGRSLGAALTGNRPLEDFEYPPLLTFGLLLLAGATVAALRPWLLAWPVALLAAWMGVTFVVEALQLWRRRERA
jgi:CDP-diacylglycerol--glycerol-3-phosphate 3-phosphatidyltransferase/cardiolipin synthase